MLKRFSTTKKWATKTMKNCPKGYEEKVQGVGWALLELVWRGNPHIWWSEKASSEAWRMGRSWLGRTCMGMSLALLTRHVKAHVAGAEGRRGRETPKRSENWAEARACCCNSLFSLLLSKDHSHTDLPAASMCSRALGIDLFQVPECLWILFVFLFHHFKYVLPFPSGLKSFYWKISCYPYGNPLECYLLSSPCCLSYLFFVFNFC